jgi:alpha-2-macroglobulin
MKPSLLLLSFLSFTLGATLSAQQPAEYAALRAEAEKHFADGSYAKANEAYQKAKALELAPAEARWVGFRLADTQWRSEAATQRADNTKLEQARQALETMVRDVSREEDRDRVWVEVQESLGDYWWTRRNQHNWGQASQHYHLALDWWAGTRDVELARARYLGIVFRVARPPQVQPQYFYGYYGNVLPLPVIENALKIAQSPADKAHVHYLFAMTVRQQGGSLGLRQRVAEEFEAAIGLGSKTDWYDDALYHYAEWMMQQGRFLVNENGGYRQEPDFVKALELFRKLVGEFKKGETRWFDHANNQIRNITQVQLGAHVSNIFLPESELVYSLNWRNVKRIDLALYPVDLAGDIALDEADERRRHWLTSINLAGREMVKSWTHDTKDDGRHLPGGEQLRIGDKLRPGAYVLEARAGGQSARDLLLITDASLVLKTSGNQALTYLCNALSGAPLAGGKVRLWQRYREGNQWRWRQADQQTGPDGLAVFDLADLASNVEIFAGAVVKDRQAFALGNSYSSGGRQDQWRIYASTDRPAYRPKEKVQWKFTARRYNGSVYSTPADQVVEFEIHDPRGTKVAGDKVSLNAFGSAWRSLDLTEDMPLGEYRVQFFTQGRQQHIGQAQLFRLEEFKLPEFKVSVSTPKDEGKPKSFRVGETVEVSIQADYYFGGPVANANVEVVVHQNPFHMHWPKPREFPWFFEDMDQDPYQWRRFGGRGAQIKREVIKTDATGRATLSFETPQDAGQDFEYQIEARVTDASRREITGSGSVRVTRQRYYVHAQAQHNLFRPRDKVAIDFHAQDANRHPITTEGAVTVWRDYWYEIWITPDGREVKGDELARLKAASKVWPPLPERPDQKDWRLKFRGYEHEEISKQQVKTDAEGRATFSFTPDRDGYYRVSWLSQDEVPNRLPEPIRSQTTVWVCSNTSRDIGYRHGGVEIIADKDTFRVGNEAPVMIVASTPGRYVLFSVEGEDLYSHRLVHLEGTVKLIDLFIEEKHVPNIFLSAAMVSDRQFHVDVKQVIVPPTRQFLTVDVQPDRTQYQPRDEGTLVVTTKDHEGKPVSAEVSLGLVDESIYYIQSDYAGDPRKFFYGTKRGQRVQTQSTFNQKAYAKLVELEDGEQKQLMDERDAEQELRRRQAGARGGGFAEGADRDEAESLDASDAFMRQDAAKSRGMALAPPSASAAPMLAGAQVAVAEGQVFASRMAKEVAAEPEPAVQVRSDFRSTVLWQPDLKTDAKGIATVKITYPDSLTGWKATARAASTQAHFGIGEATTRTRQPLIVRLQAPRFFLAGDTVVVSAVVNNNTDEEVTASVALDTGDWPIVHDVRTGPTKIAAQGEARVDWKLNMGRHTGDLTLKVTAKTRKHADAMERTFAVHEHGIEKFITKAGKVRGKDVTVRLDIPKERKEDSTRLVVQVTPSMAVTMLDALPYLINYPYGCTEQTMSRFLPAVITAKTLKDLGLQPEDVMTRAFGGIEQSGTGVPPVRVGGTAGTAVPQKKDLALLNDMVKTGLERLYDFQHADGGWGWWKHGDSDHWMTAYVVWGLTLAREAGTEIKAGVIERGTGYLDKELVEEEDNFDMQAWMLHALAVQHRNPGLARVRPTAFQGKAFDNLWSKRDGMNAYTRALLALSAHHFGRADQAKTLIANLENGVKRDDRPDQSVLIEGNIQQPTSNNQHSTSGTAHWGEDGIYWRWSDGGVEATAFALRALLTIDPENKLVEPVTNWLIKNRRGAQWSNTRDTAIVVLAMNDYLRASGELQADVEYQVLVNGRTVARHELKGADVFNAPSRFTVDAKLIRSGENRIQIKRRDGTTPIYFAAEATYFSLEEPIPAAGNEIFVKREYFRLVGRPTLLKGFVYDKVPLKDGETIRSGERIETVLTIEAKNNYEYLIFEDLKPAGIEAVQVRSGESLFARELKQSGVERKFGNVGQASSLSSGKSGRANVREAGRMPAPRGPQLEDQDFTGRTRWIYQELRDRQVALFIDKLPEGVWQVRYDFRAEIPGHFHALPVLGHAMYVPEIRCNGAEIRIHIEDAPQDSVRQAAE